MTADELLDLSQICERLKLGETTVLTRMRAGEVAGAFKIGREWRIKSSDLEAYIDKLRGRALTEVLRQRESQEDFEKSVKRANKAGWRDLEAIIADKTPVPA